MLQKRIFLYPLFYSPHLPYSHSMFYVINERNAICLSLNVQVGRLENAIGWYHSHPGYGCWLSGIDVSTQMLNQQFQEPFVAVVVRQRNTFHFSFKAICAIF